MHKFGHEHHVVLLHEAPHAMYTLKHSRQALSEHLQSCTLKQGAAHLQGKPYAECKTV